MKSDLMDSSSVWSKRAVVTCSTVSSLTSALVAIIACTATVSTASSWPS